MEVPDQAYFNITCNFGDLYGVCKALHNKRGKMKELENNSYGFEGKQHKM